MYQYVTTMVCVAIRGVPIIGVIHYPFPTRTYWGWYTKKASANILNVDYVSFQYNAYNFFQFSFLAHPIYC